MKKSLACALVPLRIGSEPRRPIRAETVYVPVLEPAERRRGPSRHPALDLQLRQRRRAPTPPRCSPDRRGSGGQGGRRHGAGRARGLPGPRRGPGETGLLAIDAPEMLTVNAWVKSGRGKNLHYAGLPVISPETQIAAGAGGLPERRRAQRQPGRHPARPDQPRRRRLAVPGGRGGRGRLAGPQRRRGGGPGEVGEPLRGRPRPARRARGDRQGLVRSAVLRPGREADSKTSEVSFVNPSDGHRAGGNRSARRRRTAAATARAASVITFDQTGLFHTATPTNPKKILRVPVPRRSTPARCWSSSTSWPAPGTPACPKGAHNLIFFHRGRFRSNTLANINAFGPGNNKAKAAQNLDLPAHYTTSVRPRLRVPSGADLPHQQPLRRGQPEGHLRHLPERQPAEGRPVQRHREQPHDHGPRLRPGGRDRELQQPGPPRGVEPRLEVLQSARGDREAELKRAQGAPGRAAVLPSEASPPGAPLHFVERGKM